MFQKVAIALDILLMMGNFFAADWGDKEKETRRIGYACFWGIQALLLLVWK